MNGYKKCIDGYFRLFFSGMPSVGKS
jgi:hypothetical protein